MKQNFLIQKFNQGIISSLGLARSDVERTNFSAAQQNNWMARVLGSMMIRAGYAYVGPTKNNAIAYNIPFVFANDDTASIELTDELMRVRINEAIVTRPSVSSALANSTFDTNLASWTSADEAGASSGWLAGGYMSLTGTLFAAAKRYQLVSLGMADNGIKHAVRIVVERGPVKIKVGTSIGGSEYISETVLGPGTHSLTFTPVLNFYVELSGTAQAMSLVDSCSIEAGGVMEIPAPWAEADLFKVRYEQSANVVFTACDGYQQYKILRYGTGSTADSWSIVKYEAEDGPFRVINTSSISLTPSALTGDITVAASKDLFTSDNIGSLFRLTSVGQNVALNATGAAQWSDPIKITGVGATQRGFDIVISGTWVATVKLQRSVGAPGAWIDVAGQTWTANTSTTYADGLDNQIIYYRIGIDTGGYTSGTAALSMAYSSGTLTGIFRITSFTDAQTVGAAVLVPLGATTGTQDWEEGEWSLRRGYPSSVCLHEGRLFFAGRAKLWGSVSDAYESFSDDETLGNSAAISRTIGSGPVDKIHWLVASARLLVGAEGAEWSARSSSLDEILTPTNCNLKDPSNQGSAAIAAVKIDNLVLFIQKSGIRLFQTSYNLEADDYKAIDLTSLIPEFAISGIVRIGVQRQPDTRVHLVLGNGRSLILIFDSLEQVKCWVTTSTLGEVEDVFVLPGSQEDKVYYQIKRTVNGSTVRYLERWAMESECTGGTYEFEADVATTIVPVVVDDEIIFEDGVVLTARDVDGNKIGNNVTVTDGQVTLSTAVEFATLTPSLYKIADSHVVYNGAAATVIPVAHLEGQTVVAWADGVDAGEYTVTSGVITLTTAAQAVMVGIPYYARYKSVKLSTVMRSLGVASKHSTMELPKILNALGVVMKDTHAKGLKYGTDFDHLDDLPDMEDHVLVDQNKIWRNYDKEYFEFDGTFDTDARLCLQAASPRPCTLSAAILGEKINEKNRTTSA